MQRAVSPQPSNTNGLSTRISRIDRKEDDIFDVLFFLKHADDDVLRVWLMV